MIRNSYGYKRWTFPGGGIEEGENAEQAAQREVLEEVGISLVDLKNRGTFVSTVEYKKDTITVFQADVTGKDFKIDPREILEAKWFPQDKLPVIGPVAKEILLFIDREKI